MEIQAIHRGQSPVAQARQEQPKEVTKNSSQLVEPSTESAITNPPINSEKKTESVGDQKGVIGLLLDGHFKGVADVRLRINFHDELEQLNNAALSEALQTQSESLTSSINAVFDNFLNSADLSDDIKSQILDYQTTFNKSLSDLVTGFEQNTDTTSAKSDLELAYATLRESISSLSLDSADTEQQDAATISDTVVEAADPIKNFLTSLDSTFNDALESLSQNLDSASILPPLSTPSGNGKAYDKFLNIYKSLYSLNDSSQSESLNLQV